MGFLVTSQIKPDKTLILVQAKSFKACFSTLIKDTIDTIQHYGCETNKHHLFWAGFEPPHKTRKYFCTEDKTPIPGYFVL